MSTPGFTTALDVRAEIQRLWDRGRLVAPELGGVIFPHSLRFRRPDSRSLLDQFEAVRSWIQALEAGARSNTGAGYDIEWIEVEHRQLGRNRIPSALVVPTRADALRLIGKGRQAERLDTLAAATLERFAALRPWVIKKPLVLLEHANVWERILATLDWFVKHPRARVYVRQIDIPAVDTKFIEAHRNLLIELLDLVLPPDRIDLSAGRRFEARYGLLSKPFLLRFRLLDPLHRVAGMSDLSTPIAQFANADLPVKRVFITENELNGLVFPNLSDSIVLFGLGYGLELLRAVPWLTEKQVHYWGDIDTHGFCMLDRLRSFLPNARALLMDRETLERHRLQWVEEQAQHLDPLTHLAPDEAELYADLAANRLGERVRLEQERIGYSWLERALRAL